MIAGLPIVGVRSGRSITGAGFWLQPESKDKSNVRVIQMLTSLVIFFIFDTSFSFELAI